MMESTCRLCCRQEHDLINLFYPPSDANSRIRFMIFLATGVEINEADIVSKLICYQCCELVIKLYKYRDHISKNDKALKEECGQLYIAPSTNVQEVLRTEAEYVKELFPLSDQFSNVLNTNKQKKNDVEYKHSSVVKLYKEYKNIILPSSIFKQNVSPTVTLMSSEVTHWLEEQEKMKIKTSHLNSTFNILSDSLKETIVNSVFTPVNVNNILTTSGNMEKLKHISISKQIIQPDKTLESYNFCVHCKQWFSTGNEAEDHAKLHFTCKSCKMKLESPENLQKHKEDRCHRSLSEDLDSSDKIITETIVEECLESKNNYNQTKPMNTSVSLSSRTTTEYVFGSILDQRNPSIVANTSLSSTSTTLVAKTTHHSPNIVANTFSLSSTPITFVRQTPTITPASRKQLSNVTNDLPRLNMYSCPIQTNRLPQPNWQNPCNIIFSLNNSQHFLSNTSKASSGIPTLPSNFRILTENPRQSSHIAILPLTAIKASVPTKESSNSSNNNNGLSTESSKVTATIKDSNIQSVNCFERCTTTTNTTINQCTQTTSNPPSIISNTPPHLCSILTTFAKQTANRPPQIIRTTSPLSSTSTTFARQTTNRPASRITTRFSTPTAFARQTSNRPPRIIVTTSPLSSTSTTHRPPLIIATTSPLSSISTTFDRQSTNRALCKIATTPLLSSTPTTFARQSTHSPPITTPTKSSKSTMFTRQITDRLRTIVVTTSSLSPTSNTFATQTTHCPQSMIATTSFLYSTSTTSPLSSTSSTLVIQNACCPSTTLSSTSTTFVRQTPTCTLTSQKQLSYFTDGMHRLKAHCDSNQTNNLPQDFLSNTSKSSENSALPSNFHTSTQSSHKVNLALTKETSSSSNNNGGLSTQSSKVTNSSIRVKKLWELN